MALIKTLAHCQLPNDAGFNLLQILNQKFSIRSLRRRVYKSFPQKLQFLEIIFKKRILSIWFLNRLLQTTTISDERMNLTIWDKLTLKLEIFFSERISAFLHLSSFKSFARNLISRTNHYLFRREATCKLLFSRK